MPSTVRKVLRATFGRAGIPSSAIDRLVRLGSTRALRGGTQLFREGDAGDSAFVVISGSVRVSKSIPGDDDVDVGTRGPGEWIGEMSMLDGDVRSATVTCDGRAVLLEIERAHFLELLGAEPALAASVARVLGARLRESGAVLIDALRKRNATLASRHARLSQEVAVARGGLEPAESFDVVPGRSVAARRAREAARRAAGTDEPVLVIGDEGSGRSELARRIHHQGSRRKGPCVPVDCAALSPAVLEASLFGDHTRGRRRRSTPLVEAAAGGSLVLENVERLSPWMQGLLHHLVTQGEYLPRGTAEPRKADVRLLATADRSLVSSVAAGAFRTDLFDSLGWHRIDVPSLAERRADAPVILEDHLAARAREAGVEPLRLSPAAADALASHAFPGNLRELVEEADRLVRSKRAGTEVTLRDLSPAITGIGPSPRYSEAVRAFKTKLLEGVLEECRGDRAEAAERLQVHPSNLLRMLRELGLDRWA
jgi:DNA-binding NtrC family response regulator